MNSVGVLPAQYNNILLTSDELAKIRGTGNFRTTGPSPIKGIPLSSNWTTNDSNPDSSSYVKYTAKRAVPDLKENVRAVTTDLSQRFNVTSEFAPVGNWLPDNWKYTPDQTTNSKVDSSITGDPYTSFGLRSTQEVPTYLNTLFFNKINVDFLQKKIVDNVYQLTGIKIKPQSEDSLLIIMRNMYQYSLYGSLPTTSVVHLAQPRGEKPCSMKDRLLRLNQAVLQETVKQILSGMVGYANYYKDASTLPTPISRPVVVTMKGSRALQENIGFSSGNSQGLSSYNMRDNIV